MAETGFSLHPDQKTRTGSFGWLRQSTRARSFNLSTQLRPARTRNTAFVRLSIRPSRCLQRRLYGGGSHSNARFGADTSSDDCTSHRVRKDTKGTFNETHASQRRTLSYKAGGLVISSRGQTSFCASTVRGFADLDNQLQMAQLASFV